MTVNRLCPMVSRSFGPRNAVVTRAPLTNVPFRLPRSCMSNPSPARIARAWAREASRSSRTIAFSTPRPIVTIARGFWLPGSTGDSAGSSRNSTSGPSSGFPSRTEIAVVSAITDCRLPSLYIPLMLFKSCRRHSSWWARLACRREIRLSTRTTWQQSSRPSTACSPGRSTHLLRPTRTSRDTSTIPAQLDRDGDGTSRGTASSKRSPNSRVVELAVPSTAQLAPLQLNKVLLSIWGQPLSARLNLRRHLRPSP